MLALIRDLYDRLTADGTTEERAVRGGIWVAGLNISDRALQLLGVVILARLLSPSAFGLLGIGLLTLAALEQFSKLGFNEALIQNENRDVDEYLNTAWILKIVRGFSITLIAFVSAPYLATFFGEPRSEQLIQVIAVSHLVLNLRNPAVVYFQKDLNFHKEFIYTIGGRIADLIVAVGFALVYRNVWALVAGLFARKLTMLILSYLIHEYRPSISFNPDYAREMFDFGKWILLSGVLFFFYAQGDDAFVGWFFGATVLGYYQLAYRLSNAPATEVAQVISRVAFPTFSKVQNKTHLLREGYFRVVKVITIVSFPLAAGIIAVAPQFVHTALGSDWAPMIPLIQLLTVWGAIRAFRSTVGALFKSVGRPDIDTKIQAVMVGLLALLIYPAAEVYGQVGVVYAIIGSAIITQPISIYYSLKIIDGSAKKLASYLFYPFLGSSVMALIVVGTSEYVLSETSVLQLGTLVMIGVVSYIGIMILISHVSDYQVDEIYYSLKNAV